MTAPCRPTTGPIPVLTNDDDHYDNDDDADVDSFGNSIEDSNYDSLEEGDRDIFGYRLREDEDDYDYDDGNDDDYSSDSTNASSTDCSSGADSHADGLTDASGELDLTASLSDLKRLFAEEACFKRGSCKNPDVVCGPCTDCRGGWLEEYKARAIDEHGKVKITQKDLLDIYGEFTSASVKRLLGEGSMETWHRAYEKS